VAVNAGENVAGPLIVAVHMNGAATVDVDGRAWPCGTNRVQR